MPEEKPIKKSSWKGKLIFFVFIVLIAGAGYGYYWFTGVLKRDHAAQTMIAEAQYGISFNKTVNEEYSRCQDFIIQKQGDFSSFEYCKKFIEWINNNNLLTI